MHDEMTRSDEDLTRDGDLADWQAFCIAYYEPILRALRLLRVPEADVEDQAHAFLLKAADRDFLKAFRAHKDREGLAGRRARFRTYLYRSLQHHVIDSYRSRRSRSSDHQLGPELVAALPSRDEPTLDPDAVYALDVLHQAIQSLRRHCERIGKPHLWTIFEETHLASEFRGRPAKSRAELLREFPGKDAAFLDNSLTTAKRAFRRIILEVIPLGLRDGATPGERFGEWMEILGRSNASQFDLLQVAYRVAPLLSRDTSQANSSELVVEGRKGRPWAFPEEDVRTPSDDEMGILLSFRMELPLTEMLDAAELRRYIPASSVFWPAPRERASAGTARSASRPVRPICSMTLLDPTPEEIAALAMVDLPGLLGRMKSYVKQLYRRTDHAVPAIFAPLFYTIFSVLALARCGVSLHSIEHADLVGNINWFLEQPWIDDRLRPLFKTGIALGGLPQAATATRAH
jgi:DNA-directed RNA polymerase specialized sigma24 family protein